eukprot:TRINITY_DN16969_c0_g1_i1.p1 TRINITY_DN16969_c0_g1~~TRINITY_DN16969_c0_g1_i1.p1  ORF type:complete len:307 (-),score=64.55 TRINITY_DN16969_c0_g1_i1:82-954(-)
MAPLSAEELSALLVVKPGPFRLDDMVVEVVDGERSYPEAVSRRADEHWQEVLKDKPKLFDGKLWSLLSHEVRNTEGREQLFLRFQLSSYKFMLWTMISPEGRAETPEADRSNSGGLMALTETSDGYVIIGLRSKTLGAFPSHWHCVPAGNMDRPDPLMVLRDELVEELGVEWAAVEAAEVFALMSSGEQQGHKPEFVFRLRLANSASEVYSHYLSAEDKHEHEELIFLRAPTKALVESEESEPEVPTTDFEEFVNASKGPLTDVTRRALCLLRDWLPPPALPTMPVAMMA